MQTSNKENKMDSQDDKKYKDFFEQIKKFKDIQTKQKQRGLNDYNMVNVVRKATHEVGMHSNVIYSLIDPNGLHYQNDLFLNIFVKEVLKDIKDDFGTIDTVQVEEITSSLEQNKRIDFTIKSDKYYIGIEMKVNHHDSTNQLSDYYEDLNNKAKNDKEQKVKIYYLTKNGKKADSKSHNDIPYIPISFKEHIMNWIKECQKEVKNITNLNEAFENYKQIVQKITKQYKGNVMTITEYLAQVETSKQKEYIDMLNSINTEYIKEKARMKKKFFIDDLLSYLADKLKENEWKVKFSGNEKDINKKYKVNIQFYKKDNWKIVYWLRFDKNNMNKMYWAVAKKDSTINIESISSKITPKSEHKQTPTSILWDYSKYDLETNIEYLINNENNKLAQKILDEFNDIMYKLENDYKYSLEDMNNDISQLQI
jgi:hypothetical protein